MIDQPLKVITLMEDNLCGENQKAEHGLSLYLETRKHKLLVDTGQSDKTWENALAKGVDISQVDIVILSHGHYDHSGGLLGFTEKNDHADIYLRDNAGEDYYSFKDGKEKYIGINKKILDLPKIHLVHENTVIDDELSLFTQISPVFPIPKGNKRLHVLENGEYMQDDFSHEQYLVIQYERDEYALISGCAHNGILNILDEFHKIYKKNPSVVFSGFHMIQPEYSEEDLKAIEKTAERLASMDTVFYTGHCTGSTAFMILKKILKDKLVALWEI